MTDAVTAKEREAAAARARLTDTLQQLQHKLSPATIAAETRENLKARGTRAAKDGAEWARVYPARAAGIGAGVVLLLFRKPIGRLFRRRGKATPSPEQFTPEGN